MNGKNLQIPDVKSIRFLVSHSGVLKKFCKIALSVNDASLYIFPYAPHGRYYGGKQTFRGLLPGEERVEFTFDYTKQSVSDDMPKLSIHETGQVHIEIGKERVGPVFIPQFRNLIDEHIATVTMDNIMGLPEHNKEPNLFPPHTDLLIETGEETESLRLLLYVNGDAPNFKYNNAIITLGTRERKHLSKPIFIGLFVVPQSDLRENNEESSPGVLAIAGWDPRKMPDKATDLLFIRGN